MNLPIEPDPVCFYSGSFVHKHDYDELRKVAEGLKIEYEIRADWIAKMCRILGHDNSDGFHSRPDPFEIAESNVKELKKLRELNEEKFNTIQAYCKAASHDKWKINKLEDAIDQYISAAGYSEHTRILTEARADVVNAKPWDKE